ncbi:MAG: hypothetical protein PHX38_07435 [Sulfuricella sp.]|nr:hypothetical protein [Sulfuricella sp.]
MLKRFFLVFLLMSSMVAHAGRLLPQNVQVGRLNGFSYPDVRLGGQVFRLAPGVRIYDTFNRIIIPTSLPSSGNVFYQLDPGGMLIQMWLPTAEEEAGMSR